MTTLKHRLILAAASLALPGMALAAPLSAIEDGFTLLGSPDSVIATIPGAGGSYGGPENLIDGDLSTGFPNLTTGNVLTFTFDAGLVNATGANLVIVDGRYDSTSIDVSVNGFASFLTFDASDFYDTGVDDALTSNGVSYSYSAYALLIDLSDFGIAGGDSISSFSIRSDSSGFDPIDVAAIGAAAVPLPAGLPLLLAGLGGLGLIRRKRA